MRRPILAGNWKMNKTRDEAIHFVLGVDYKLPKNGVDCIICAPAIILRDIVKRADILQVGAQNMNENDKGAYTGEISPIMLKDTGVKYVIIGHSERRMYYNETDQIVNAKIKKALEYDSLFGCTHHLHITNTRVQHHTGLDTGIVSDS